MPLGGYWIILLVFSRHRTFSLALWFVFIRTRVAQWLIENSITNLHGWIECGANAYNLGNLIAPAMRSLGNSRYLTNDRKQLTDVRVRFTFSFFAAWNAHVEKCGECNLQIAQIIFSLFARCIDTRNTRECVIRYFDLMHPQLWLKETRSVTLLNIYLPRSVRNSHWCKKWLDIIGRIYSRHKRNIGHNHRLSNVIKKWARRLHFDCCKISMALDCFALTRASPVRLAVIQFVRMLMRTLNFVRAQGVWMSMRGGNWNGSGTYRNWDVVGRITCV